MQTLGRLTVASGGAITGSIDAGALVLEPGNLVEARVKVGPPPKSATKATDAGGKESIGRVLVGRNPEAEGRLRLRQKIGSRIIFAA